MVPEGSSLSAQGDLVSVARTWRDGAGGHECSAFVVGALGGMEDTVKALQGEQSRKR